MLLTDQIFIFGPAAVVARFQDDGVSTTQPGFLDVALKNATQVPQLKKSRKHSQSQHKIAAFADSLLN